MEIDLTELESYEKQLAERRSLRQQQQQQPCSAQQTDDSSVATMPSPAPAITTTATTSSQNVDEIDAFLDRLALDLQAKDQRTNDARHGVNSTNHINHQQHQRDNALPSGSMQYEPSLTNTDDSSQNNDCDTSTAAATAPQLNLNQTSKTTSLPLLIYAFLSILAYVNTIRCKHYVLHKFQ